MDIKEFNHILKLAQGSIPYLAMLLDSFEYIFKGEDAATTPSISGISFSGTTDAFSRTA